MVSSSSFSFGNEETMRNNNNEILLLLRCLIVDAKKRNKQKKSKQKANKNLFLDHFQACKRKKRNFTTTTNTFSQHTQKHTTLSTNRTLTDIIERGVREREREKKRV